MDTKWIKENFIKSGSKYSHLKLLAGWILYFILYLGTDKFIPVERCHVVHSPIDDMIPFCEHFLIFYCAWYAWIVLTLLYYLKHDVESFKKLQVYFIVVQIIAVIFYIIYPTIQIGRPETFARDNIFTQILGEIYAVDTPTGVCPSIHVAYSIAIAASWINRKKSRISTKVFTVILAVLISASTVLVKQHSIIDVFAAIPLALLGDILVYGRIGGHRPPLQGFIDKI